MSKLSKEQKKLLEDTIKDLKDINTMLKSSNQSNSSSGNGDSSDSQDDQSDSDNNQNNNNQDSKDNQNNSQNSSSDDNSNNQEDKQDKGKGSGQSKDSNDIDQDLENLSQSLNELEQELDKNSNNNSNNTENNSQQNKGKQSKQSSQSSKQSKSAGTSGGMPQTITLGGQTIDISKVNTRDCIIDKNMVQKYGDDLKNGNSMQERLSNDLSQRIRTAFDEAEKAGHKVPSILSDLFEKQQAGKAPGWIDILKPYLKPNLNNRIPQTIKAYKNRRTQYSGYELLYPYEQVQKDKIKGILFAIDTSGSINPQKDLVKFYAQVAALMKEYAKSVEGAVCFWDDQVEEYGEFKNYDEFKEAASRCKGGGGTRIMPVLQRAKDEGMKLLVVYTDGCFGDDDKFQNLSAGELAQAFNIIIWILYDKNDWIRFNAPFGIKCLIDPEM